MILKRIMTCIVALVVAVVSISAFGVLWNLRKIPVAVEAVFGKEYVRWEGKRLIGELYTKEGAFDRFLLYCRESD